MFEDPGVVIVGVVLLLTLFVGYQVMTGPALEDAIEYSNQAEEWCSDRGGELQNSQVIGEHGGLHCEFPNGTTVHMDEVNLSTGVNGSA